MVSLGNNVDLFINSSAAVRYVSNIFLDDVSVTGTESSDTYYILTPGVELRYGDPGGAGDFTLVYRHDIKRYSDFSRLDIDNPNLSIVSGYAGAAFDFDLSARYYQTDQSTADIQRTGRLVVRDIINVNTTGEYILSPKTSFSAGIVYNEVEFEDASLGFFNRDSLAVPLNFYWQYSPLLDFGVGYRYRNTEVDSAASRGTTDHFFFLTTRGELAPKLSSEFRFGVQKRDFDAGGDNSSFSMGGNFTYAFTPKASARLDLSRDFDIAGTGDSTETTRGAVRFTYAFSPLMSGRANFSYSNREYADPSTRADDTISAGFALDYNPNDYVRISAGYTYQENDSSVAGSSFDNSTVNVSASLRY